MRKVARPDQAAGSSTPDPARVLAVVVVPLPRMVEVCRGSSGVDCVPEGADDVTGAIFVGAGPATGSLRNVAGGLDSSGTTVAWAGSDVLYTSCCNPDPDAGVVNLISA